MFAARSISLGVRRRSLHNGEVSAGVPHRYYHDDYADYRWRAMSGRILFAGALLGDRVSTPCRNGIDLDEVARILVQGFYILSGFHRTSHWRIRVIRRATPLCLFFTCT